MGNVFANLPMPPLNGAGAAVDVSAMGRDKTIVIDGVFPGASIAVEISQDAGGAGAYAPVTTFTTGDQRRLVACAARYMRVNVSGRKPSVAFSANADVGSSDIGAQFAVIPIPAGNGAGAPVNVSALGTYCTFVVGGTFPGAVILIEASEDGIDYAPVCAFASYGGQASKVVTGSFFRATVTGRSPAVAFAATASVGAINDPTAPPTPVAIPGNCLIYRPGSGDAGPVVFDVWADLMAKLAAMRAEANGGGCYTIEFDDAITTPATIPAGAYDMTDVTWEGTDRQVQVAIDDGATFTHLRRFIGPLAIVNNNLTTPACSDLVNGDLVIVRQTWLSTVAGGVAFFLCTQPDPERPVGITIHVRCYEHAAIGPNDSGPVFSFDNQTTLDFAVDDTSYVSDAEVFYGTASATLEVQIDSLQNVPTVYANWLGTIDTPNLSVPMSLLPEPYRLAPATANFLGSFGQWLRFNASGGPIAQILPAISAAPNGFRAPGAFVFVSERGGGVLTLAPAVGDTIQGAGAAVQVPPGGSMLLTSDGVSDWTVAASFASGGTSAGQSTCLIYQPGGTAAGPGTFASWPALMARLAALRAQANGGGCYTIQFDASLSSPATIPAGGPYDMSDVTWEGAPAGFGTSVSIANGATFSKLKSFRGDLDVVNHNAAAPACADLASGDILTVRSTTLETVAGGQPFYNLNAAGAGCFLIVQMYEASALGSQTGPVFTFPLGGGSTLFIAKEGISSIAVPGCLVGVAGTTLSIATSSLQSVETVFPNWAGTVSTPRVDVSPSLLPVPYLGVPSTVGTVPSGASQWLRKNASGGAIPQSLPKISTATNNFRGPGCFELVSESGGGVLTLSPNAGDTINGSGSSVNVPASGALFLISDGVSNWTVVGKFGNNRLAPPEKWGQNNVAANQAAVALSALVSVNFNTIRMVRAGSIVAIATQLSEACTAGTLTVQATINGAPTTLSVVTTNASNTTGGQSTQQAGVDRFVAGDLVGMVVTTTAGWLPITSDLESWLEVEEVP